MADNYQQFIESFDEGTQDKLTKSMLESSLIFAINRSKGITIQRNELFLKTIFAIIISEKKSWTTDDLLTVFRDKFGKEYKEEDLKEPIRKLLMANWIRRDSDGKGLIPDEKASSKMSKGIAKVNTFTDHLINSLIVETSKQLEDAAFKNETKKILAKNIKDTLNLYVRMYGIDDVSSSKADDKQDRDISDEEDLIKILKRKLDPNIANALVNSFANLIGNPTQEQAKTIKLWIKAYIGSQIMRLDPQLSHLQAKKMNGKTFILDTDFVLYSITSECKQSKEYKKLLKILRNLGCRLVIPDEVVTEVLHHAQYAENNYNNVSSG